MTELINETSWAGFLKDYTARHKGRPTRLGIIESRNGVVNDYWLEDGLPLVALDAYLNKGIKRVDIVLDKFTHAVEGASSLITVNRDDVEEGLNILDEEGKATILRFENWPGE